VILYHFTGRERVSEIVASGVLKPTDPALRRDLGERAARLAIRFEGDPLLADAVDEWSAEEIEREFGGPLVVHLTADHRDCSAVQNGKNTARFTVNVPRSDARPWVRWARNRGITESWLKVLRSGHRDHQLWHVVGRPIPASEWEDVIDTETQDVLWARTAGFAAHLLHAENELQESDDGNTF
jgi:hypothetical protein